MRSGGGSMARIGVHVGQDWWTFLSTYEDRSPILDIAAGSTTVTVCFDGKGPLTWARSEGLEPPAS